MILLIEGDVLTNGYTDYAVLSYLISIASSDGRRENVATGNHFAGLVSGLENEHLRS